MQEHPFAPYIRILARGKSNTRPLTMDEADAAMTLILTDQALPEQIGAFLMVLRYKEETPQEVAGFVQAARRLVDRPMHAPQIDLDWSCYAGKRRQLPWFALSALLLAQAGIKIFMHGVEGHTAGRIYAEQTLRVIGVPVAESMGEAADILGQGNLCYLPLARISPKLAELIDLKSVLGLRSPVHTLSRLINPFAAEHVLQGIFHPGFNAVHQQAAALIGQPHLAVFRGEGGEIERRPQKPLDVLTVHEGVLATEHWPAMMEDPRQPVDEVMDLERLKSVWQGSDTDAYATSAIIGTTAIALKLLQKITGVDEAQQMASALWQSRDRTLAGG